MADVLEITKLTISFSQTVVHGIDLAVRAGSVHALVGESGSGKTVTSLAVLGLLSKAATVTGGIRLDGKEIAGLAEKDLRALRGATMGMVFQDPRRFLDPSMRLGRQLMEVWELHDPAPKDVLRQRAEHAFSALGLEPERTLASYPHELSGGMCQRAAIAIAMACNPALLIADEPTSALDASVQKSILDIFVAAKEAHDMAILLISHDLRVVAHVADEVTVLYKGRVMETGPKTAIIDAPVHPYTKALLAAVPRYGVARESHAIKAEVGAAAGGCPFATRCPRVMPRCHESVPLLASHGERSVACFAVEGESRAP